MKVLGIDPGVSEVGWACIASEGGNPPLLSACGLIKTSPRQQPAERLLHIHRELTGLISACKPDSVGIEEFFLLKAAHTVRRSLEARGVIMLAAAQAGLPIGEYNPRSVKLALTGSGSAQKPQMQKMVQTALALKDILRPDDVADAAAIALCHLRMGRLKSVKVLSAVGGRP